MTIGGAISDLNNLLKADDIPIYYKPSIKKVIETIEQEPCEDEELDFIAPKRIVGKMISVDVLDKIRAEIENIEYLSCPQPDVVLNDVLQIIDKHRGKQK